MPDTEAATPAHRRTTWRIVIGLSASILVLVAVLIAQRLAIAHWLIDSKLRALGLEEVDQDVERLDFREFGTRNLRIGINDDFSAEEISVRYSLGSLLAGRLAELSVRGVRLRGRIDQTGVSFGALDPLWRREAGGGGSGGAVAALPARHIAFDDVVVELETPEGPITARFTADVSEGVGGEVSVRASLEAEHALFEGTARLDARGTPDAFGGDAAFDMKAGGEIVAGTELEATELAGVARFAYSRQNIEVLLDPIRFALALGRPGGTLRLEGGTPALSLAIPQIPAGKESTIHIEANGGSLALPDLGIEARDLGVDLTVDRSTGRSTGSFRIGSLSDSRAVRRLCELAVTGTLDAIGAQQTFEITATNSERGLTLEVRGSHDPRTGDGSARVEMRPIEFQPGGLQPAALSPLLKDEILEASGGVDLRGDFRWNAEGNLRGGFDFALRDLSISSAQGSFEQLNAVIHIDGPWPPSTPPHQLVSMARMDFGLELDNGLIEFRLRPDGVLDLASAEWSLAGGTIRTQGEIDLRADTQELVLTIADLDLAELLKLADLAGLSGSGTLRGSVPIRRRGPTLEIRGGVVSGASAGGWIRYRPDAGVSSGVDQQPGFGVVLAALENFHYEKLQATLDGDTAGPVTVAIHLAGANPDYLGGDPIEFNLGIESHLVDLLKNATAFYQIPAEIEKRLTEMSKKSP